MIDHSWQELVSNLENSDPIIRGRAAESLGASGDRRSGFYLRKLISDPDFMVRFKAAIELAWRKDDTGVQVLLQALHKKDLCFMTLEALCELGSEKSLSNLQRFFSKWSLHPLERMLAAAGLHRLGDRQGSDFLAVKLDSLQSEERGFALELWGRLKMPQALDVLMKVASDPYDNHQLDAVRGLAWLEDTRCLELLMSLSRQKEDALLAEVAAQAIVDLEPQQQ